MHSWELFLVSIVKLVEAKIRKNNIYGCSLSVGDEQVSSERRRRWSSGMCKNSMTWRHLGRCHSRWLTVRNCYLIVESRDAISTEHPSPLSTALQSRAAEASCRHGNDATYAIYWSGGHGSCVRHGLSHFVQLMRWTDRPTTDQPVIQAVL